MTIDEAIAILEEHFDKLWFRYRPDNQEAVKLGIEALKLVSQIPILPIRPGRELLPGETKD